MSCSGFENSPNLFAVAAAVDEVEGEPQKRFAVARISDEGIDRSRSANVSLAKIRESVLACELALRGE